jgi:energy-coupling factor transporter ATP-binding protein EcfA2
MRLDSFGVQGFRSLSDVPLIPVRKPTILTGENDGGKSSALGALSFLLNGQAPAPEDFSFKWASADLSLGNHVLRVPEIVVTGNFSLSPTEQINLDLPAKIQLRRRVGAESPIYEIHIFVPQDVSLRGIENMRIQELRDLAAERGLEPEGKRNELESWRAPLRALAATEPKTYDWIPVSRDVIDHLPIFLSFSSREEPDPEAQVRSVLQATYKRLLDDTELIKPVRELEDEIKKKLQAEAEELCSHIKQRIPELTSISAIPSVSFRDGFGSVQLRAMKGNEDVGLKQAGAGRQRRISLAVWEWISMPQKSSEETPLDLVVAYDEPDTHLDYGKQRELVDLIHAQCQLSNVRMIVATHSLNLIDRVDISDVVQLRLDKNKRTVVERLLDDSHDGVDRYLSELSVAMGLRTSVLLHERCFLAVEGPTEEQTFPYLFRLVTGKPMQSAGVALICGDGNNGALQVTQFLIRHKRAVVFIVDKDSTSKKVFSPEKLRSYGVADEQIHFVGAPNELEELYSDQQWTDTANEAWPRRNGCFWATADIAALRSGKFSDNLKYAIGRESGTGVSKQEMNMELVHRLTGRDEVPEQLREKLEAVARIASGD